MKIAVEGPAPLDSPKSPSSAKEGEAEAATPADSPRTSRRRLLGMGAALAAAVLVPGRRASAQRIVRPHTVRPEPPPISGDILLQLVRRVTNGITPEELARARSLGFRGYLDYHLNPAAIPDTAVENFVAQQYPLVPRAGIDLYLLDVNTVRNQLRESTLYRGAFSNRQLYERMVNFWSDHFNIYYSKVNYLKLIDEREVIRQHALGKFPDMLRASAHSPAMLEYLDNTRSRGLNVNQNYARELMELHTMGADGGYTQTDVEEVTRCFTGWTIAGRGEFRFDPTGHDFTAKTVLGTTIPAQSPTAGALGIRDGETVLQLLLAHPSTARFISRKMIRWLLRYDPPADLVTRVAATFTRTGGDIPSMIRDILTPANLLAAPAKYRQPYQFVLASLRATRPTVQSVAAIAGGQLSNLSQPLFQWEDPDGYPDNVDWWAGLVLQRWNFAGYLTTRTAGVLTVDVAPLMTVATPTAITDSINQRVYGGSASLALKQLLTEYLSAAPITTTRVREALSLALSSNEFQWF